MEYAKNVMSVVLRDMKGFHSSIVYIICGPNFLSSACVLMIYLLVINYSQNNSKAV